MRQQINNFKDNRFALFLFLLMGLVSLIWLLIRIISKPSRAKYTFMIVAAPIASGFLVFLITLFTIVFSFKKARAYFRYSKYGLASVFVLACIVVGVFTMFNSGTKSHAYSPKTNTLFILTDAPDNSMRTARGIIPGRLVWRWNPCAASWDGSAGYWWSDANANQKE